MFYWFETERKRERERGIYLLTLLHTPAGDWMQPRYVPWPDQTCNILVHRMMLQPTEPPGQD